MNHMKRLAALLLAMVMVFSALPVTALATEEGEGSTPETTETAACTQCSAAEGHETTCPTQIVCETCSKQGGHEATCATQIVCETCGKQGGHETTCPSHPDYKAPAPEVCEHGIAKTETCADCTAATEKAATEKAAAEEAAAQAAAASADRVKAVQDLIDALPEVTAENKDTVLGQMQTIDTAKAELTDAERGQLVITKYVSATETLKALNGEQGGDEPVAEPANDSVTNPDAKIGEQGYATLADAITAAGDGAIIELVDGTHTMPSSFANKNITIKGSKNAVVQMLSVVTPRDSTINFEGVTAEFGYTYMNGLQHSTKVTYTNCTLNGTQYLFAHDVIFTNCTFNVTGDNYNVWTWGATNVTFTDCTFNSNGKAVLLYGYGPTHATLNNCVFKSETTYNKAAVETGDDYGATYTLTINNCTADNTFVANKSTSNLWGNKNSMDFAHLKVTIDGKDVTTPVIENVTIGGTTVISPVDAVNSAAEKNAPIVTNDAAAIEAIVTAANASASVTAEKPVEIKLPAATSAANVGGAVKAVAESNKVELTVPVASAEVTFNTAAAKKIAENAGTSEVTLSINDEADIPSDITGDAVAYEITMVDANNNPVFAEDAADGTATVSIPLPEGATSATVYYYPTSGDPVAVPTTVDTVNSLISFTVAHFSKYVSVTSWYNASLDEFVLDTPGELMGFAELVNTGTNFSGKTVKLGASIDLTGEPWPGIGIYSKDMNTHAFQGTFDGQNNLGYKITGVTFDDNTGKSYAASDPNNYRGFFNQIGNATVKNLTVTGNGFGTVSTAEHGGALIVGHAYNSTISGCVANGSMSGNHNVAGIVVRIKDSSVTNCTNNADLQSSYTKIGGIVALSQNSASNFSITGCKNTGDISSTTAQFTSTEVHGGIGGIIGWGGYPSTGNITISGCSNTGMITATDNKTPVGQIAGQIWTNYTISGTNTGRADGVATSHSLVNGLTFATVSGTTATYVKNDALAAGNTYLITAKSDYNENAKPVIELKAFESIAFDTSLVSFDDTGITAVTSVTETTEGNVTTYTAAAPSNWIDVADTSWYNDTDTEFTITTAEELAGLAKLVNEDDDFKNKTIKLGADIDLKNTPWTPIGNADKAFKGTFDGGRHTISNLFINSTANCVGLIGNAWGPEANNEIKNLTITNANVTGGNESVAVLVGKGSVKLTNCHVNGSISVDGGTKYIGGIAGYYYGTMSGCSIGSASAQGVVKANNFAGVLVGFLGENSTMTGNTVTNMKLEAKGTGFGFGAAAGNANYGANITGNTVSNITITSKDPYNVTGQMVGQVAGENNLTKVYNNTISGATVTVGGTPVNQQVGGGDTGNLIAGNGVTFDNDGKVTGGAFEVEPPASVVPAGYIIVKNANNTYGVDKMPENVDDPAKAEISKTITIKWDDESDKRNLRPSKVTITLYADGVQYGNTVEVPEQTGNEWTVTIDKLPKYKFPQQTTRATGIPTIINYTIKQSAVGHYTTTVDNSTLTITNKYKVPTLYVYSPDKLLQTGAEIMPIGLLTMAGIAVLAAGMWLLRKKSYER